MFSNFSCDILSQRFNGFDISALELEHQHMKLRCLIKMIALSQLMVALSDSAIICDHSQVFLAN